MPPRGAFSFVKLLRMLSVMRVFKLVRNFDGATVITNTVQTAWERLVLPLFFLFVFVVVGGCIVYAAEHKNSLGEDQMFPEMLSACWFTLVTMTTTGYGRYLPTNVATKVITIGMMILGNFYMAMPLTIVGSTFWSHYMRMKQKKESVEHAKEHVKKARRHTMRMQAELDKANLRREKSKAAVEAGTVNKATVSMLSPVQESAFHQLFDLERHIDELLTTVQNTESTNTGLCELMLNPRTMKLAEMMATTEHFMAYMVKDSLDVVLRKAQSSMNGVMPAKKSED